MNEGNEIPPVEAPLEVTADTGKIPKLLFTTHVWWEDRAKETFKHIAAPKFVGERLIQLPCKDNVIIINSDFMRKAVTSVEELPEENGHAKRIIH